MTVNRLAPALFLGLAAGLAGPLSTPADAAPIVQEESKGVFTNAKMGFKVKPPKGWKMVPLKTNEAWLACKYTSDKSYSYHNKERGWTYLHTPELKVIAFVKANMENEAEIEREKDEDGDETITVTFKNPYKDYNDYLDLQPRDGVHRSRSAANSGRWTPSRG